MTENKQFPAKKIETVLRKQANWKELWFYQKTQVLYLMTTVFTRRILPRYGDRTVDQMRQAARSGKQNIVEGSADGVTSIESELKLLNVARGSILELREDYEDYLLSHRLTKWTAGHPRFETMIRYCREHNQLADYEPFFEKWTAEEIANIGITLCRMVDKMMMTYQKKKEADFLAEGGIRERMTAARLNHRNTQRETIDKLTHEVQSLKRENAMLKTRIWELGG